MPSFTQPQVRVMETALESDRYIAVNKLVNMLKEEVPGVSGAYAEKVTGFRDEWLKLNPVIGNPMPKEMHINITGEAPILRELRVLVEDAMAREAKAKSELEFCILRRSYAQELLKMEITGEATETRT